ncbi:hypothetical protein CJ030_MR5G010121 [Morella rubra]|uniref:Uncharacterized protein n=1 Tax=Morella rubra TaxID=262757 RepID=A0A6A1VJ12_9ROSI|nr:hypothetical protein CJ030_MR5G010121 [Morella rubra]
MALSTRGVGVRHCRPVAGHCGVGLRGGAASRCGVGLRGGAAGHCDHTFEDGMLLEAVEQAGWLPFIQRTGYASKNMVREFYYTILRARNLEELSMEVIVRNIPITFLPNELARFLDYKRDLTAFLNLPLSEEGQPTKVEDFRKMLGEDTTTLKGSYMIH